MSADGDPAAFELEVFSILVFWILVHSVFISKAAIEEAIAAAHRHLDAEPHFDDKNDPIEILRMDAQAGILCLLYEIFLIFHLLLDKKRSNTLD